MIAGATGLVGRLCLHVLLENNVYSRVIALSRRPIAISDPKLEQEILTFDHLSTHAARLCDAAYCTLGTTIRKAGSQGAFRRVDHDYVERFAVWARAGGAQSFALVSSVGADAASRHFYLRTKGEAERSVARVGFRDIHLFRPGILVGERQESRFGEAVGIAVSRALQFLMVGGLRKYRPIAAADVARAMVRATAMPDPDTHVYHYPEIIALSHAEPH